MGAAAQCREQRCSDSHGCISPPWTHDSLIILCIWQVRDDSLSNPGQSLRRTRKAPSASLAAASRYGEIAWRCSLQSCHDETQRPYELSEPDNPCF